MGCIWNRAELRIIELTHAKYETTYNRSGPNSLKNYPNLGTIKRPGALEKTAVVMRESIRKA